MQVSRVIMAVGFAACTVSCGGGDRSGDDDAQPTQSGLAGMYQTTAVTLARPCDAAPQPDTIEPPYFEILDHGAHGLVAWACEGADPSSCDMQTIAFVVFAKPIGGGVYRAETAITIGSITSGCAVDYYASDVSESADGVLIRRERRGGSATGPDCGGGEISAAAIDRFSMLPCQDILVRQGARL